MLAPLGVRRRDLIRHPLMPERLPAILLAVHLLYLFILPSLAAKAASAVGCLVSLVLYVGPRVSGRFAARLAPEIGPIAARLWVAPLALFALPLVSLVVPLKVAFWRVDGRALLIIAWLAALWWALAACHTDTPDAPASPPYRRQLSVLTQLFILWSALFWLTVIWDVGIGRAVALVVREDRLTTSFELWETRPASDHLFLVWLNREFFEKGVAYTNHLHPVLFFFYGCSKLVQLATGLPLYVGRNLTPVATACLGVLAFAALVPRPSRRAAHDRRFHAALFLALGFFLSEWHFWVYPFTWGFDTVFPLIAYLTAIVWASANPRISGRHAGRVVGSAVLFAAFGWLYTPLIILALWCLFGRLRPGVVATFQANRPLARASIAAAAVGVAVYALPLILITVRGYENAGSPFVFRSGLDGDTRYFQNAVQAVLQPFRPARNWWSLLSAFVPLTITLGCAWSAGRNMRRQIGRQAVFLLAPYFFSLALFPQSVSIHPNLYDSLLILPIVLMGSTWCLGSCVQSRLRGAPVLAALLAAVLLIMSNLIGIAQGVQRLLGG